MATVKVLNLKGENVGSLKLNDNVFGADYNEALIHEVIVAQLANARQGTKSALTRTDVRGHSKKPWRQKHTGRARHGSTKGPQWRGGGVAFAPRPRDFSKKVNKEARRVAFRSAISAKLNDKDLIVVDDLAVEPKTKAMVQVMESLGLNKTVLFVTKGVNSNAVLATGNIPNADIETSDCLSVYDLVVCDKLVVTKDAIKSIEEAYEV